MSPRFTPTPLRTHVRGLGAPTLGALSLIAIIVAGMFAAMVITVRALYSTSRAQVATSQMTEESLQLERLVVDLETGVRGFMLTDDRGFLEPYDRGRGQIAVRIATLHRLSPPSLRARVDAIDERLA